MADSDNMRRLRWKCRRGMLELDLFFERFLDGRYADLSDQDKQVFERLLEESDTALQQWFLGQAIPNDPALADLVQKIR